MKPHNVKYLEFRKKKNRYDSRVGYRAVQWYDESGKIHFASYENFKLMFPFFDIPTSERFLVNDDV